MTDIPTGPQDNQKSFPNDAKWSRTEWLYFGIAIDLLLVWILVTWIFGYTGFILIALGLVISAMATLVLISRG